MGGVAVGTYSREESRLAWTEVQRLLAKASMRPLVDSVFAFDKLPDAFEKLAQGPMGKVLLAVKD
jgi:NADPH2:quinone reductase